MNQSVAPELGPSREVAKGLNQGSGLLMLRQHPLFQALRQSDFDSIARDVRRRELGRGEVLYKQDSDAHYFYFVVSGRVRLYRLDSSGQERTLDSHGVGECFADVMIYAEPARYAAYAEPLRRSQFLAIPTASYREVIARDPEYTEALLRLYAERMYKRFQDLEVMTVRSGTERVVRYLLDFLPRDQRYNIEIELPLPQCQIATRLAMQPETLSRLLRDLSSQGMFSLERGRLHVPDRCMLEAMCR